MIFEIQSNMLLPIEKTPYSLVLAVHLNLHSVNAFLMKMIAMRKVNKVQPLFEIFPVPRKSYSSLNHFT